MEKVQENRLLNELDFEYVRSSGPGGQKVNKTASKVQLRWNINESKVFTEEKKERIRKYLHTYRQGLITKKDDLILECDDERFQSRNKEIVIERFKKLIQQTLKKKKKRKKTKPSKAVIERRLEEKKRQSEKKKSRQKIKYF